LLFCPPKSLFWSASGAKEKTFLRYGEKGFNAFIIHTVDIT